jgi:quinol monooxygenase YgiN
MTFQNVVVIRHRVANYRKWKAVFDAHGPARAAHGCQRAQVFRRADQPKEVVVMLTWSDLVRAREFVASDDLREMLVEAGVDGPAHEVYLLEELAQSRSTEPGAVREPSGTIGTA